MGAVDCVSAMVEREHCDPKPLLGSGVEIGLHIEFEGRWAPRTEPPARPPRRGNPDPSVAPFAPCPPSLTGTNPSLPPPDLPTPSSQPPHPTGPRARSANQ